MPSLSQIPDDFICRYRHGCPYLEGLSTHWVGCVIKRPPDWNAEYEYQLEQLNQQLHEVNKSYHGIGGKVRSRNLTIHFLALESPN